MAATAASQKPKYPAGIPYIIGNEAAERFSYYGMRAILAIFMTKYLMDQDGNLAVMGEAEATAWFHTFTMANYFFPILGAILSDVFWGKYKTILWLSIVYCFGHLALALDETRLGLSIGLTLIAIGAGGIKPCVSAHVGDQFSKSQKSLIEKIFGIFYFSINFGAFFSTLLTPILLDKVGPAVAFGVPGALMLLATIIFRLGHDKFTIIKPVGWAAYKRELLSPAGRKALMSLPVIYIFVAMFWALYDQTGSSWVLQADRLNRVIDLGFTRFEILPSQVQAINPILVLIYIPFCTMFFYPLLERLFTMTPLRKIGAGFFLAAGSFGLVAYTETLLATGQQVSILWQLAAFAIITFAEVMVSITALEFSYTQAPNSMKSFIMGIFMLSVSLGNALTALINFFIQNPDGSSRLAGAEYFWMFAGMMFITAILFIPVARLYKEESYIQDARG